MQAELHIDGITTDDELETLRHQLDALNTVQVTEASRARLFLDFDPEQVNANMIEGAVNAAGADVIRMDTSDE